MSKTFAQVATDAGNLLIVDALNLAFRWKHKKAVEFAQDYISTIESLKKSYKAKWLIVAADKGSSSYRKEIYPEYKQNRKEKAEAQTEEEALEFEIFITEYNNTLDLIRETTSYPVLQFNKTEADDIAAYICSKSKSIPVNNIWLISSDKDWDLLISPKISRFSYVTRKEVTYENWYDSYPDFDPEDLISVKCLQGDTGDNIFGVEGVGPKRAVELVKQYGTAYDIVANIPLPGKYKYIQSVNNSGDRILTNYQLMDLVSFCSDALGPNTEIIDKTLKEYIIG